MKVGTGASRLKRVFLFRHGETDWNAEQRFQGHLDVPLNDRGRAQARELAPALLSKGIEVILSSDLSRARETAELVAAALGVPVHVDPRLREAHLGHAQGLTRQEIEERFGEGIVGRWRSALVTDADVAYPGGETGRQVRERVFTALEDYLRATPAACVGVATHGGVIRRLAQALREADAEPVPIPNGVLYEVHLELEPLTWRWVP